MTDEQLAKIDGDIASALIAAADYNADKQRKIVIKRNGEEIFSFTIQPVNEDVMRRCRRENTLNRGKRTEELDGTRFVAQLIFEATVKEDKKKLWLNREVQEKLNCASGADVIQKVLTPAERSKIEEALVEIGSYDSDGLDEMIKNA